MYGIADGEVLNMAYKEGRIVITHDKDFGIFLKYSKEKHTGVILLRLKDQRPENGAKERIDITDS